MSRIHEALKRAEQERAAGHNGQKGENLVERSTANEVAQTGITPPNILAPALLSRVETETLPEVIRVEELWAKCARPQWKPDPDLLVFGNSNPFNPGTEQFRTLRSRLYKIREGQPLHTLLISSAIPAEGKTVVATNLAHAMVRQRGCRVLLVDADLRSPRIHTLLGAPATPGLAEYLQGGANEFEVIQRGHEEGLCFTPAGNHVTHPSELISSSRMKQFIERVKPAFDWVIVDSPPALPVADASVLGGICDGVLLVVRANATPSGAVQKACRELRDTNIIGVVLNSAEQSAEYNAYYTYGGTGTIDHSKDSPT
jgi:protein-tyrosine kinase